MKLLLLIALVLGVKGVPFTPMEVERLPDLNIPREAHGVALAGGEFTVFGGHATYISTTLNSGLGMSFPRFPEKNLSRIADEAGFANENSFFRAFKTETGLTPTEWREKQSS